MVFWSARNSGPLKVFWAGAAVEDEPFADLDVATAGVEVDEPRKLGIRLPKGSELTAGVRVWGVVEADEGPAGPEGEPARLEDEPAEAGERLPKPEDELPKPEDVLPRPGEPDFSQGTPLLPVAVPIPLQGKKGGCLRKSEENGLCVAGITGAEGDRPNIDAVPVAPLEEEDKTPPLTKGTSFDLNPDPEGMGVGVKEGAR
jgi:hypothetical protein